MIDVEHAVAAVRAHNGALRALCLETLEQARARDRALASQAAAGPLHRVPYSLKDVWDVEGLPTTRGSGAPPRIAAQSGAVHCAFEEAGAVLVGKSNLSDAGLTPESESYAGGVTVHPLDPSRTAGGSSGGAACAVASGMAAFDWGTDFGGSIRLPAAFCGVVGMRLSASCWPVPEEGGASSPVIARLNGMGPIARDLSTCRAVLRAAAPLRREAPAVPALRGLVRLAPDAWCRGEWPGFDHELAAHLERRGVPSWPAPLPPPRAIDDVFVRLLASHAGELTRGRAGAMLSALTVGPLLGDRRLHPRSAEVLAKLAILRLTRARDVERARGDARRLARSVGELFAAGFVLVTPTTTFPAPPLGTALGIRGLAAFVKLGNVVDATALSLPFGSFPGGLPRGLQLLGPPGSEGRLLDLAERITR